MEKVTKKDLLNKEIKQKIQINTNLVKAVANNTTYNEKK